MEFKSELNKILESAGFNWSKEKKIAGIEKAASLVTKYPSQVTLVSADSHGERKAKIFKGAFGLAQILGLHPMVAFIKTKTEIDPSTGEEVEVNKPLKVIPVIPSYIKGEPLFSNDQVRVTIRDDMAGQIEKILKDYGIDYIKDFQSRYDVGLQGKDQKVHGTQFRMKVATNPAPIEVGEVMPSTPKTKTPSQSKAASAGSLSDAKKRLAELMKGKQQPEVKPEPFEKPELTEPFPTE